MKSIRLKNFQCFRDSGEIPIHNMTVFIGENDSGKSTILKALEIFFNNRIPPTDIFQSINGKQEKECEIQITFFSLHKHNKEIPREWIIDDQITIKKIFKISDAGLVEQQILIQRYLFSNNSLNEFVTFKADSLKELCRDLKIGYTTSEDTKLRIRDYIEKNYNEIPKTIGWGLENWNVLSEYLPIFESYNSATMLTPSKQIENTLKTIYRSFFYDYNEKTGQYTEKKEFKTKHLEIETALNKAIGSELKSKIQSNNKKIQNVTGKFFIDFAAGFSLTSLLADFGQGERDIDSIGEGSKRRLFLAISEWEREIRQKNKFKKVIRAYDEPDTSLHYRAQKEMFFTLKSLSEQEEVKIQPLVCTHSISMIDRAPPRIINHVVIKEGVSHIEHLTGDDDQDVKNYLDKISEISGISNSSIFFERCFLIVEGETEETALPILYKKVTNKSLPEDGVVITNLETNSTWKSYLKLLNKNKRKATLLFLDSDIQTNSRNRITKHALLEIGFDDIFYENNVILVGTKEFEDILSNEQICKCLNSHYPKVDGESWIDEDIQTLRSQQKFSKALSGIVGRYQNEHGIRDRDFKKPEFGIYLGLQLSPEEINQIPCVTNLISAINRIVL